MLCRDDPSSAPVAGQGHISEPVRGGVRWGNVGSQFTPATNEAKYHVIHCDCDNCVVKPATIGLLVSNDSSVVLLKEPRQIGPHILFKPFSKISIYSVIDRNNKDPVDRREGESEDPDDWFEKHKDYEPQRLTKNSDIIVVSRDFSRVPGARSNPGPARQGYSIAQVQAIAWYWN
jgi:hypothetical protein